MRTIYRLNFTAGGWTERESIIENRNGVDVDTGLEALNTLRQTQPGTIVAQRIYYELYKQRDDGSLEVLDTKDSADEIDPILAQYQDAAAQEARDRYSTNYFKVPLDPQPEGLND